MSRKTDWGRGLERRKGAISDGVIREELYSKEAHGGTIYENLGDGTCSWYRAKEAFKVLEK